MLKCTLVRFMLKLIVYLYSDNGNEAVSIKLKIMLSNTITSRALDLVLNNPTMNIMDAVKEAIIEENKLIAELLENRTERSKNLNSLICQKVYNKLIKK